MIAREWGRVSDGDLLENQDLIVCLDKLRTFLIEWSKKEFPNNGREIQKLMGEFKECCELGWNRDGDNRAQDLTHKIDVLWEREEKYWLQRARVNWLRDGDANTNFFHKTTQQHRARNKVVRIQTDGGSG